MILVKDSDKGVFPGISVQLLDFENPAAAIATVACHALPAAWGCYHLPNEVGDKTMIFHLEDSPFRVDVPDTEVDFVDEDEENYDVDSEEYRPHNGDVWVFHGTTDQMWDLVKNKPDSFINCLVYHKLDQGKKFSANIMDLHEKGAY